MSDIIKKTSMFFTGGDKSGCYHYRSKLPGIMLEKQYYGGFPTKDERTYSSQVVFIQRAADERFLDIIPAMKKNGQKIVYDLDDNLFEIPSYNPAFRPYNRKSLDTIKKIIKLCDAVVLSTDPLKEYFVRYNLHNNIFVIPNFFTNMRPYRKHISNEEIVIGYSGTITHSGDFDSRLVTAIRNVLNNYNNVYFKCLGYNPVKDKNSKILFQEFVNTDSYLDTLDNMNINIGIAPLVDNDFNRSKSNIKYMEYSNCSIPCIASNVYPYVNSIANMKNGIIINDNRDWEKYIRLLIENEELRNSLAYNAYTHIKDNFTYENNGKIINELYTNVLESIL